MRVFGLDIGKARIGIASGVSEAAVASPLAVLPAQEVLQNAPSFKRLIEDWEPEQFVVGLPLSMSGEVGPQAESIKQAAAQIEANTQIPVVFVDERLSSSSAKQIMHESGYTERDMRGKLDAVAASVFLQTWLEGEKQGETDEE